MEINTFEDVAEVMPLVECLGGITDPRMEGKNAHLLIDILVISICAIICGAEHWTEIEDFGKCKKKWFSSFLKLPNGIPSHDTIGRVFALIDPKQLQQCYVEWIQEFMKGVDVHHICLDGKTVRGSRHAPDDKKPIHMISAYAHACGLVLTQEKVDATSNEITALPDVLKRLVLAGAIVSIDAMGCQSEIAKLVKAQGGEYVLSLKGNQGKLAQEVEHHFECAQRDRFVLLDHDTHNTVDRGHGRLETRRYDVIGDAGWLDPKKRWGGLAAVGRVVSTREVKSTGVKSKETRYYILSRRFTAKEFAKASRNHWGIENSLHWILDVAFGEDSCRVHAGCAAENFVVLRHIALGLLKQGGSIKRGIKTRRKVAGWDENYLLELLKADFHA
ncbi:MAG: ISAs1 family transposase [Planctomycetes bacterium]|nr:ISAs1 family transposase [Planctomycetota bacterium]